MWMAPPAIEDSAAWAASGSGLQHKMDNSGRFLQMYLLKNNRSGSQLRHQALVLLWNQDVFPSLLLKRAGSHSLLSHLSISQEQEIFILSPLRTIKLSSVVSFWLKNIWKKALAEWLGWLQHRPVHQRVVGWLPGRVHTGGNRSMFLSHWCFSLSLSSPPPLHFSNQ